MELRNKKTGEIRKAEMREDGIYLWNETLQEWFKHPFRNLADYWEEYEEPEPKDYWYIADNGVIVYSYYDIIRTLSKDRETIGNWFDTREEAEKVVEQLKAWKRLRDKGFRFNGWKFGENKEKFIVIRATKTEGDSILWRDLDLLFGGEE